MTYTQAKNALDKIIRTGVNHVIVEGKIVVKRDCYRVIEENNNNSPEDYIEQIRRDI